MMQTPESWSTVPLMDAVVLLDSKRIPLNKAERSERQGEYPYYGANGLVDHVDSYLFDGPYVLLAEDGGNFGVSGKPVAYKVDGRFWVNNHAHILKPLGKISNNFILHWCNSFDWMPFVGGTTRLKLTQQSMHRIEFPLPPLAEQKRIVAKLESLSAKSARARDDLTKIDTLVTRYKQAVLQKAFSGELTDSLKADWNKTSIGALVSDIRYGTSKKCCEDEALTPVLRIPNVVGGNINHFPLKHAEFSNAEKEKLQLELGDILVVRSNGSLDLVGRSAVVEKRSVGYLFAGYLIRLRFPKNLVSPSFLHFFLREPIKRREVEALAKSTSGVNNINSQQIKAIVVWLPSLAEQEEIVQNIETAFQKIDRLATEAKRVVELLGRLDEAILAKAFKGDLVQQDPADEPASVLLDRIRAEREAAAKPKRTRKRAKAKST